MPGDPVRINRFDVRIAASRPEDGRRFGEALARELQTFLTGAAGGRIDHLDIRVRANDNPAAVAQAVRDALVRRPQ